LIRARRGGSPLAVGATRLDGVPRTPALPGTAHPEIERHALGRLRRCLLLAGVAAAARPAGDRRNDPGDVRATHAAIGQSSHGISPSGAGAVPPPPGTMNHPFG